ncbi:MAG: hypothetical protein LBV16_02670 [Elusimicrobiota bacterium]|jgi:hypothetical protein|nr:hypothetical protein [Elusimicrobiota bacterium]
MIDNMQSIKTVLNAKQAPGYEKALIEQYENALENGVAPNKAFALAAPNAVIQAALEKVGLDFMFCAMRKYEILGRILFGAQE